ncbi:hypothetical protein [Streptomyces sp. CT34]|uniref:hypothetical protein n=1 Tax=Streptomyces sp. CT34 TaxID=1553907 RepID=UPI0005BB08FB|nr:hypothetical protein [Streptomyces sp. CT34]
MEQSELATLLGRAAIEGVCPQELVTAVEGGCECTSGVVARDSLIRMYQRRLRRTDVGTRLHDQTAALIEFLINYSGSELTFISVRPSIGGFHAFLADVKQTRILFWMEMLDQRPPGN